jgi:uncharacterized protein
MKALFYNKFENRLRAGWRILIISSFLLAAIVIFSFLSGSGAAFAFPLSIAVLLLLWFASKKLDKRPFSEYGFAFSKTWFRDFAAGNIMAGAAMSVIVLIKLSMDWMVIDDVQFNFMNAGFIGGLLYILVLMLAVSIWEEAYFRSYLITNFKEGIHFKWLGNSAPVLIAVVLSSLIFGLLHAGNPNASWISTLNISIAGMVFAYPYIITKSIAIPIGMHLSWNYFQGAVFGLPVSGNQFDQIFMVVSVTGPEVFTGGSFGPEAGAAGLLGLMVLLTLNEVYITAFCKK